MDLEFYIVQNIWEDSKQFEAGGTGCYRSRNDASKDEKDLGSLVQTDVVLRLNLVLAIL